MVLTCRDIREVADVVDEEVTWAGEILTQSTRLITHVNDDGGAVEGGREGRWKRNKVNVKGKLEEGREGGGKENEEG